MSTLFIFFNMDSVLECKTPKADGSNKPELFSPPFKNTPLTRTSSKGLLTPCRQVGLKRRSLKREISPSINGTEIACTSSDSSPLVAVNENECITTPSPLKKRCVSECESTPTANQSNQVDDMNNKKDDGKSSLHENTINSISCTKADQCEILDPNLLTSKKESTLASELMKLNSECKFKITPKRSHMKKRYRPTSQCERALTYENCEVVGEKVQNKIDTTDRSVHSKVYISDIHWSSAGKIPHANDFSDVVKTVPVSGEIKPGEDLTDKIRIMRQYVKEKEEQLRLLKLSQLYRKKHDPEKLSASINRWREICKAALYRLQEILTSRGQPMTMADLLAQFGIPHDVLKFNSETDDFE